MAATGATSQRQRGYANGTRRVKTKLRGMELDYPLFAFECYGRQRHCRKGPGGFSINSQSQIDVVLGLIH